MVVAAALSGALVLVPLTLLVGGLSSSFIGNVVYSFIGINANIPFAAAFAVIPVVIMGVYLTVARRLGAFEAL